MSQFATKMSTFFVFAPEGRENSSDGGARGGAPRRHPLECELILGRFKLFLDFGAHFDAELGRGN